MKNSMGTTLSFLLMICMNSLANILPINGKTTGELSDQYPNLFVPAGITFSIWAVIYALLFVLVARQFFSKFNDKTAALGWPVTINFLLNAAWIIAWHYEHVFVSVLLMLCLLSTLVVINYALRNSDDWMMRLAFGIYIGWICLAVIANITAFLVALSWPRFGISEQIWTAAMIIAGAVVGAFAMRRLANPFLALALVWGFYGIVLKRQMDYPSIAIASYVGMSIVLITAFSMVFKGKSPSSPMMMKIQ